MSGDPPQHSCVLTGTWLHPQACLACAAAQPINFFQVPRSLTDADVEAIARRVAELLGR